MTFFDQRNRTNYMHQYKYLQMYSLGVYCGFAPWNKLGFIFFLKWISTIVELNS